MDIFFLISNKNHINHEEKSKTAKTRCSWWWTQETATKSNKKMKSNLRGNTKGSKKLQSRRTVWRTPSPSPFKKSTLAACNWTNDFSLASKERRFLSIQTTHIKQSGTIFYMLEENFPNQLLQQNTKLSTEPGMTHWIPKTCNICTHKKWATGQCWRRWSIDSLLQQHIQYLFAKGRSRDIKLSKVSIWPWVAVHMKKATLLGTLAFQIPFQGKLEREVPLILL